MHHCRSQKWHHTKLSATLQTWYDFALSLVQLIWFTTTVISWVNSETLSWTNVFFSGLSRHVTISHIWKRVGEGDCVALGSLWQPVSVIGLCCNMLKVYISCTTSFNFTVYFSSTMCHACCSMGCKFWKWRHVELQHVPMSLCSATGKCNGCSALVQWALGRI